MARPKDPVRLIARIVLAAAYAAAGTLHLRNPEPFLSITPGWVPFPEFVIAATGVAELAGAVGLLIPRLRYAAGVGLALYAVCVYPANVQHALDPQLGYAANGWAYHGPRLLAQPLFVWWALWVGRFTDWPFGRRRKPAEADDGAG